MTFIVYLLILLSIFVAFLVILLENPVYAVLSLVFLFLINSIILLFLELEFFALLYIIVYVGAVAVLFLFVIMMLDLRKKIIVLNINYKFFIFCLFFGLYNIFMTFEKFFSLSANLNIFNYTNISLSSNIWELHDIFALNILFSKNYGILLVLVGIMFFIVMLGTINLHLEQDFSINFSKKKSITYINQHGLKNSIKLRGYLKDISFYEKVLYSDLTFLTKFNFIKTLYNYSIINYVKEKKQNINTLRLWNTLQLVVPFDFYVNISHLNIVQPGLYNFFDYFSDKLDYFFNLNLSDFFRDPINYNLLFLDFYDIFNYDV